MQAVSTAYKAQIKNVPRNHSYVRVSYGVFNLLAGQQAQFSDNGHTAYGNLNLNDDILPDRDYATFEKDYWRADGSQLILPATGPYNYDGFVSSAVSSDDNTFATNPTIAVSFTDPQDIFGLTFTFPEGQVPQEITVNGTAYYPDSENYVMPDRLQDVTQVAIEFVKAPAPGRRVRLNRLQFGQTVTFENQQLVKTSFESSIDFLSLSLTQKKFSFTIDNKDQVYNPLNPQGLYAYLEAQQPLETEYGYELDDGTIEWVQGDSTVSESTPITADEQATFSAVDALTNLTGMFRHGLYRENRNLIDNNFNAWESGQYQPSDGGKADNTSRLRLSELVAVKPSTTYYCNTESENFQEVIRTYDSSRNFLSSIGAIQNGQTFTTPAGAYFISVTLFNSLDETIAYDYQSLFADGTIKPFMCLNSIVDKSYAPHDNKISLYDLAAEVLTDAGVEHYVIDDHLKTVYTKAALPVATHRECLQIIANAGQCILYTDRRGYIKLEIALDPTIRVGDNGHMAYSDSSSAYNDMDLPTAKYADFLPDSWKAEGKKIILPSVGPYIRTGFVSDSICDKDGSMTDTQSGSRIEFRHAIDSALQSLTIAGQTIESGKGDKSPDNPYTLTGLNQITVCGKNLIKNSATIPGLHGWCPSGNTPAVSQGNGFYRVPLNSGVVEILQDQTISVTQGSTYTESFYFKTDSTDLKFSFTFFGASGHHKIPATIQDLGGGLYRASASFNMVDTALRCIDFNDLSYTTGTNIDIAKSQLEINDHATSYESYEGQTITLPQPLYSLPDGVHDDYDAVSGMGTRRVGIMVLNGSENWVFASFYPTSGYSRFQLAMTFSGLDKVGYCNRFPIISNSQWKDGSVHIENDASHLNIVVPLSIATTAAAFKAWLASHPVTVLYELASPTAITGTPQQIRTYYPYTQIINDAGAEMEAVAPVKTPVFFWKYSFPYSAYQIPITFDNVDGEYATEFDVVYKLAGTEIDRVSVTGNTSVKYTVEHEVSGVDEIDIEIHKWSHGTRRAMIAQIGSGRANDMNIDFSTATAKPTVEKSSQVRTVTVNCYSYVPAADTTELYHADITLDGDVTLNVSHDAATEITASVTGVDDGNGNISQTDAVIISQEHYTYYSVVTLTGTQPCTLTLTGKVLTTSYMQVINQLNSQGEEKDPLQNPLITDLTNAQNEAIWVGDYFSKRNFLTTDYRGNPEIDAHDLVYMESEFEKHFPARIMDHKLDFNGALSGNIKAVALWDKLS